MRRHCATLALTGGLLLTLAGCASAGTPEETSDGTDVTSEQACEAATLTLAPERGAPGTEVAVSGENYLACADTGEQVAEPDAVSSVDVYAVRDGMTINLGEAQVDETGALSGSFTVPTGAEVGELEVMAGDGLHVSSEPATFTVE